MNTPLQVLLDARVQQVHVDASFRVQISLRKPDLRGVLLVCPDPHARGLGWLAKRVPLGPALEPASTSPPAFQGVARKYLKGARLHAVRGVGPRSLSLEFRRGQETPALILELHGQRGNVVLQGTQTTTLGSLRPLRAAGGLAASRAHAVSPHRWPTTLEELTAEGRRLAGDQATAAREQTRQRLLRAVRGAERKLQQRQRAVAADEARGAEIGTLRRNASLLLSHLHELNDRQTEADLLDHEAVPPVPVRITIDPKLGARAQAQQWFERARRLERGVNLAAERALETAAELVRLEDLRKRLEGEPSEDELLELSQSARALRLARLPQAFKPRRRPQARLPFRVFALRGGLQARVGRSARDNDLMLREHSRPHDLWLHARGSRGAHVIVPLDKNHDCPADALIDAGLLAAHFSDCRGEHSAEVLYVARRHVHRPRKAAPGLVTAPQAKTLLVRIEPDRLSLLLTQEQ